MSRRLSTMVTICKNLSSTVTLNDGNTMPMFGLGMYLSKSGSGGSAEKAVTHALKNGYKMIDTAEFYGNESDVGQGIKASGLKREDYFVVTKVWTNGSAQCRSAFTASLKKLDIGYVDLYLIHSPSGGKIVETYKTMMEFQKQGLIKSIGVSNFGVHHLQGMKEAGLPTPTVNQIELHPWMKKKDIVQYCQANNIAVMGFSPLVKGQRFTEPCLMEVAERLGRTTAEVLIRYSVQMGYITIPKSSKPDRILANASVFDWEIPQSDMDVLNSFPEKSCSWNPCEFPWEG
ncbi:glyoxal reductase-like isoform X2 [Haliotis rufescens]|nr:glyoxal reductase-like isoform X2 [Haliotis rufescens]